MICLLQGSCQHSEIQMPPIFKNISKTDLVYLPNKKMDKKLQYSIGKIILFNFQPSYIRSPALSLDPVFKKNTDAICGIPTSYIYLSLKITCTTKYPMDSIHTFIKANDK